MSVQMYKLKSCWTYNYKIIIKQKNNKNYIKLESNK